MTDTLDYWVDSAHTKPEAVALAARLDLDLPRGEIYGINPGLLYPVRRLVVTGEDTPENFAILFGPQWQSQILDIHKQARLDVLLCPPPTSPGHVMAGFLDEGCPFWRPRDPSVEEEKELRKVHNMQRLMEGYMTRL